MIPFYNIWQSVVSLFYTATQFSVNEYVTFGNISPYSTITYNTPWTFSCRGRFNISAGASYVFAKVQLSSQRGYRPIMVFPDGYVYVLLRSTGTQVCYCRTTNVCIINNQHHTITVTKSTSSITSGVKIYVDGVSQPITSLQNNLGTGTLVNSWPFTFGNVYNGTVLNGTLDNLGYWNRELTAAECLVIHNKGSYNVDYTTIPNLVDHWRMDTLNPVSTVSPFRAGTSINQDATNLINYPV